MRGLEEFPENIKEYGVLEPILVKAKEEKFEVIVGERRVRASILAGLKEVPAIIRALTDRQTDELRLIENIHREDLTTPEKGDAVLALLENYPEKYPTLIRSITREDILRVAKNYLHPNNTLLIVVANLKEAGFE